MNELERQQEEKMEIQQHEDGTIERTETKKEIVQQKRDPQNNSHEIDNKSDYPNHLDRPDLDFDFSWLLWGAIIAAVIFFIWRRARD